MTPSRRLALLCAVMILGSLAFGVIGAAQGLHAEFRYYIYLLPFFFLPIAYVVKSLIEPIWGKTKDKHNYYLYGLYLWLIIAILLAFVVALPAYYSNPQKDDWRLAEELTHGSPRIVIPTFNQIPLAYYSHENESGYTYYSEVPGNFSGYVIVGPAGGYDPPMQAWFEGLPVYRNVTGIVIYKTRG